MIGEAFKMRRERRGLTKGEAAKVFGISYRTLDAYENNHLYYA